MNRLKIAVAAIMISFAASAFANGPMPDNPAPTGGTTMSPGRQKFTKRRITELGIERKKLKHSGPGVIVKTRSKLQQLDNPLAFTEADAVRAARKKAQIKNAIEILALKKERGELSPQGQAQLNALINYYRTNYMSGY